MMTHTIPPAKVDGNQPEIVAALRAAGYTVAHTHMIGRGFPDILVSGPDGVNVLMEIKMPGEKLTPAEQRWHNAWPGELYVVYNVIGALNVMGAL